MDAKTHDFLKAMLAAPGPSGYEEPVQAVVREYAAGFADEVRTDVHGNVILGANVDAPVRLLLAFAALLLSTASCAGRASAGGRCAVVTGQLGWLACVCALHAARPCSLCFVSVCCSCPRRWCVRACLVRRAGAALDPAASAPARVR